MRTEHGARAAVKRSGVSQADWARALGVSQQAMSKLVNGFQDMRHSPTMARLQTLLDKLESGEATWVKPAGVPGGKLAPHRLRSRLSFAPAQERRVDFLGMRLSNGIQP